VVDSALDVTTPIVGTVFSLTPSPLNADDYATILSEIVPQFFSAERAELVYDTPVLGTETPLPFHLDIAIVPFGLVVPSEFLGNVPLLAYSEVIGEVISKMSIHYLSMHDDAVLNDLGSLSY
jgi:hypothetical protein